MKERIKKVWNNKLIKKIICEYLYISIIIILFIGFIRPFIFDKLINDNTGIDGIGVALLAGLINNFIDFILALILFIINPIKILITCRTEIKSINSKIKKIICILITILPIIYFLFITFNNMFGFTLKYETGKNSYSVNYDNYKSPKDFESELTKRNLIYNKNYETILSKSNDKYRKKLDTNKNLSYQYIQATLEPLYGSSFYDHDGNSYGYNDNYKIISFDDKEKAPIYVYNSYLFLLNESDNLQYMPLSFYQGTIYSQNEKSKNIDGYYIKCKILYVDGDIYAILGLKASPYINMYYNEFEKNKYSNNDYPYAMILSEKETITTYYNDKYYHDGAIENHYGNFAMAPNTIEKSWVSNFPVRKVERLDSSTINKIALELQNGDLKKSIDYYFSKQDNK